MRLLKVSAQRYVNPRIIEQIGVSGREGAVQVNIWLPGYDEAFVWKRCKDFPAAERELAELAKAIEMATAPAGVNP